MKSLVDTGVIFRVYIKDIVWCQAQNITLSCKATAFRVVSRVAWTIAFWLRGLVKLKSRLEHSKFSLRGMYYNAIRVLSDSNNINKDKDETEIRENSIACRPFYAIISPYCTKNILFYAVRVAFLKEWSYFYNMKNVILNLRKEHGGLMLHRPKTTNWLPARQIGLPTNGRISFISTIPP